VELSPLAALLAAELGDRGAGDATEVSRGVLRAIEADGFEAWLALWARRLAPVLDAGDEFTRMRLRQLVAAGRTFDESGARNVDEFLRFLAEHAVREPEGSGVVRVMTVHKSKGLGFDVVILPDLEGQKLAQRRDGPAVRKAADRSVSWVLQHPGSLIAERDPVLREYQAEAVAESCYEQLSLLYVALTRAKRAQYVVIERPGKSGSRNFPRLLTETLGADECDVRVGAMVLAGAWSEGDGAWFAGMVAPKDATADDLPCDGEALAGVLGPKRAALPARRPSRMGPTRVAAERLFANGREGAADFGTAVHVLLAGVEWADATGLAQFHGAGDEEARSFGVLEAAVLREAEACLNAPELRAVFAKENSGDVVWREQAFEAVVDGAWVSGVLDRVVIRRGVDGSREVAVFDFKTERVVGPDAFLERHSMQLGLYRRVVARLTGVEERLVRAFVVATAEKRLHEIVFPSR
jgi:ATP-dependent exoDNAse (exonuclease V) beta subunit